MNLIDSIQLILSRSNLADEVYYEAVAYELANEIIRPGLWAMALADTRYDERQAKARYLRLRVETLKIEVAVRLRKDEEERRLEHLRRLESEQLHQLQIAARRGSLIEEQKAFESETLLAYQRADYNKAFTGFTTLALQGNAWAENYLGYMYEFGQGTSRDVNLAIDWYKNAAEKDNPDAQYHLGRVCLSTPPQDYDSAVVWLSMAEKKGRAGARDMLKQALLCQKAKKKQASEFEAARKRQLKAAWVKKSDYVG